VAAEGESALKGSTVQQAGKSERGKLMLRPNLVGEGDQVGVGPESRCKDLMRIINTSGRLSRIMFSYNALVPRQSSIGDGLLESMELRCILNSQKLRPDSCMYSPCLNLIRFGL
jgi:hypothetical protein